MDIRNFKYFSRYWDVLNQWVWDGRQMSWRKYV